jgi:hypothetical protein
LADDSAFWQFKQGLDENLRLARQALQMQPPAERQALLLQYEQGYTAEVNAGLQECSIQAANLIAKVVRPFKGRSSGVASKMRL